jgi:phosphopantetheinyl transferase
MDACILAYTRLPLQAPRALLGRCAAALPYARRLRLRGSERAQWQSLAGLGLACWLLRRATGRDVRAAQLRCPRGGAPCLPGGPSFSIAHAGEWVACVLARAGAVGLDLELPAARAPFGTLADWVAREAVAKAAGRGLAAVRAVVLEPGAAAGECGRAQLDGRRWQLLAPRLPVPLAVRVALELPAARGPAVVRVPFLQACAALAGDAAPAAPVAAAWAIA